MTTTTFQPQREPTSFWKRAAPLWGGAVLGVAALIGASTTAVQAQFATVPGLTELPVPAQLAVAAAQPIVLVSVATAAGTALAPRLGLRSWLAQRGAAGTPFWAQLKRELPLALGAGAALSLVTIGLDLTTRTLMPPLKPGAEQLTETVSHTSVPSVLAALLYGGITEEVLLRWGFMTLLAWIGWKLVQRGVGKPRPAIMWAAIGLSSLIFGVGHLPATAIAFELTPFVIARALVANGVFGLLAGWLYWRRSLEAAMAAHMAAHLVLTGANLLLTR